MTQIKAWHFTHDTLRDGRPIPSDGTWLHYDGKIEICESGLHASKRIIDALAYAPGSTICRVTCADIVESELDKFVCRKRRIDWRIDGEELLREFARKCALDVIHLWNAPQIVKQYLETGDETIRVAARNAALAAGGAALAAGRAALATASATAKVASATTWTVARIAARAAQAAGDATRDAAWATARDAARDAAWATARDAARDAAWAVTRVAQNKWLVERINLQAKAGVTL